MDILNNRKNKTEEDTIKALEKYWTKYASKLCPMIGGTDFQNFVGEKDDMAVKSYN